MVTTHEFNVGIEEEFFLVDKETMELKSDPPAEFFLDCKTASEGKIVQEAFCCQVEINTAPCASLKELKTELSQLRSTVLEIADKYDIALLAAGTHPFSDWSALTSTSKERYITMAETYCQPLQQSAICGMHAHVGIDDQEIRTGAFNLMRHYLPYFLAFSTSSPFWEGRDSGLDSYRSIINGLLPRSGIPNTLENHDDYENLLNCLTKANAIKDGSEIWWDMRLSVKYPTIEMRITDVCPLLDDAIAIVALYLCLLHKCAENYKSKKNLVYQNIIFIKENRWRAERYSFSQGLFDIENNELIKGKTLLDRLVKTISDQIEFFQCQSEIDHLYAILENGTSAAVQRDTYTAQLKENIPSGQALKEVVRKLVMMTRQNV